MQGDADAGDIRRIRRTWARAAAGGDMVGRLFYGRLFEIAPATRALFPGEMDGQSRKLMQTLNWIVDHLETPENLAPQAEALALRHVRYGVEPEHYAAVGQALIETLRRGLGDEMSADDADAWARVYGGLADMMIGAAYPERAAG
jgi:nitric oxide dioxygenase